MCNKTRTYGSVKAAKRANSKNGKRLHTYWCREHGGYHVSSRARAPYNPGRHKVQAFIHKIEDRDL